MTCDEVEQRAYELFERWGLDGWTLEWSRSKTTLGDCSSKRRIIRLSTETVPLTDRYVVEDTLLHEIAHALAGSRAGHGPEWRRWARTVGARPERCGEGITPAHRYVGRCPVCGEIRAERHRIVARQRTSLACAPCRRTHGRRAILVWEDVRTGEAVAAATPTR